MAFTPRQTGKDELDRVQYDVKKAFDATTESVAAAAKAAATAAKSPAIQPTGVTPGTYTIAGLTSITIDEFGRITKIV